MQKPEWPAHKIVSLAVKGYENIFYHLTGEIAFYSTYFRINYLSKPITGLINKTSQLFLGRVISLLGTCCREDE